mmetsp:Transcript_8691/g.16991  ORF Transcript_8691/g.16991 Transcript_8691/m.16991 type:complete len:208 (-) Transcript_8691:400-1023(-)
MSRRSPSECPVAARSASEAVCIVSKALSAENTRPLVAGPGGPRRTPPRPPSDSSSLLLVLGGEADLVSLGFAEIAGGEISSSGRSTLIVPPPVGLSVSFAGGRTLLGPAPRAPGGGAVTGRGTAGASPPPFGDARRSKRGCAGEFPKLGGAGKCGPSASSTVTEGGALPAGSSEEAAGGKFAKRSVERTASPPDALIAAWASVSASL